MENPTDLAQSAVHQLSKLPPHRLVQALGYIDYLIEHTGPTVSPAPQSPRGNLDDLLACAGIWVFDPDEMLAVLEEIERSRQMELEEARDGLPA